MNLQMKRPIPPLPPMCHGLSDEILAYIKNVTDERTPGLVSLFSERVSLPARFKCELMPYTVEEATELYAKDVPRKMRDHLMEAVLRAGRIQGEYDMDVLMGLVADAADLFVEQETRRIRDSGREISLVSQMITDDAVRPFLDKATRAYVLASDVATALAISKEVTQRDLDEIHAANEKRCQSLLEEAKGLYESMLEHNRLIQAPVMEGVTLCLDYVMGRTTRLPMEVLNDVSMRCNLHRMATEEETATQ